MADYVAQSIEIDGIRREGKLGFPRNRTDSNTTVRNLSDFPRRETEGLHW